MTSLIIGASIAFRVWMFLDAVRRGAPVLWWVGIALPFGDVLYFLLVKAPDLAPPAAGDPAGPDIEGLRDRCEQTPSLANRVALGAALYDTGEYAEALDLYRAACRQDPDYLRARYGLALCQRAQRDFAGAVEGFRSILERDRSYADWAVWVDLAEALARDDQDAKAMAVLEALVEASPRLDHVLLLAAAKAESGQLQAAKLLLERGLEDHRQAPPHVQRATAAAARGAAQLLAQLAAEPAVGK